MLSHYAECHYAECHYAECHYAECRGTINSYVPLHRPKWILCC
jgi:hypothetical protein